MMQQPDVRVDNALHLLHWGDHTFPCGRDIETVCRWREYALLLSSDTDCLSLWDADGLVRLTRVGVYPQDMALHRETAYICGGADGLLHLISLPNLHLTASLPLPGMPERICIGNDSAYLLTLLTEPDVHTLLLELPLKTLQWTELERFAGIPERVDMVDGEIRVEVL